MKFSPLLSLVTLGVGVLLLVWGFNANDLPDSGNFERVSESMSKRSIVLMTLGAPLCIVVLVAAIRRL